MRTRQVCAGIKRASLAFHCAALFAGSGVDYTVPSSFPIALLGGAAPLALGMLWWLTWNVFFWGGWPAWRFPAGTPLVPRPHHRPWSVQGQLKSNEGQLPTSPCPTETAPWRPQGEACLCLWPCLHCPLVLKLPLTNPPRKTRACDCSYAPPLPEDPPFLLTWTTKNTIFDLCRMCAKQNSPEP